MPVDRFTYSSLTQLLRNPLIFKMKEILGVYDSKMSVSGMIGRSGHEALKFYYGGNAEFPAPKNRIEAISEAKELGLKYLDTFDDAYIKYGKTGSREKMLQDYTKTMDIYFSEEPTYHKILMCEEKMSSEIHTLDGDLLPLPAVGVPDLVIENENGEIEIVDHKFVTSFTDYEVEDYIKIVQSQFLFHLLLATKGIKAKRMIFREIKRTVNQDGSSQIRDWAVPFDHEPYRIIFYNLYKDAVKFISNPDAIYLPNLSDMYDGEHSGMIYAQGLINADMSDVEVMHKVRDLAFVSKKFVGSRLDRAENQHLLPEERIKVRLAEFGIPVEPQETVVGSTVTQYRFKVSAGVSMSSIKKHKDDIRSALEVKGEVRIIAPIQGTNLIGVEVENMQRKSIKLTKDLFHEGKLQLPIGVDVNGEHVLMQLNDMPHLLIAGSTGSGKSVTLHGFITALTKQLTPAELRLVLIDPKRVELAKWAKSKHLWGNIRTDYQTSVRALLELVEVMEERYKVLEKAGKRDIEEFNASKRNADLKLPYIVTVIDEFADLILTSRAMEKKTKLPSYNSKTKTWLYRELQKRVGKSGEFYLPHEDDAEKLVKHTLERYGAYSKDILAEILERLDSLDPVKGADVEMLVIRLAQMARATGIHLIIATQRPSVDVITGLIKANFPTRIALTTSSPQDSVVILGQVGAEKLAGKGDMLFQSPALRGLVRLQGYYL